MTIYLRSIIIAAPSVVKMTSVQLTAEQRQLVDKIATQNGFTAFKLNAISGSAKGDNYMGLITSVTIEDGKKKLGLILKSALLGEFRNQMPMDLAYLREIFIYENVFTKFEEFQEEFGLSDPFRAYAKLYGTCVTDCNECLVLENLRDSGYKMWDRKIPMNSEHLAAVINEYAKFHAVSLAMKEKKPEEFEELTKSMTKHTLEEYFKDKEKTAMYTKAVMANIFRVFEDDIDTTERLNGFVKRLPDIFVKTQQQPKEFVIDHGDCWCNNFMFGYESQENFTAPLEVRILDWQLSKIGSPAMDLAYFFLVNSSKKTLYDYENYLKLYHHTLARNLREFSCDPEKIFPYSALLRQWNERIELGMYMAFNVLKLMLCDSEEAPDLCEICDSGNNLTDFLDFETKDTDRFNTRIKDLVEFAIEKEFI